MKRCYVWGTHKVVLKQKLGEVAKIHHLFIAYSLQNISAKSYHNPTTLARVTAKNVGDPF